MDCSTLLNCTTLTTGQVLRSFFEKYTRKFFLKMFGTHAVTDILLQEYVYHSAADVLILRVEYHTLHLVLS